MGFEPAPAQEDQIVLDPIRETVNPKNPKKSGKSVKVRKSEKIPKNPKIFFRI
jgi:hypothetical protein